MKALTAGQLTELLGDCLQSPIKSDVIVCSISTDTRTLTEGDTFVALSGERFDGHAFVDTAIKNGAAVILAEKKQAVSVPQIVVSNSRLALAKIAGYIRDNFVNGGGKIVGLTGSVGKTTNKEMIAAILAQAGKTHATKGNLNNDLGVPFTWFALPDNCDYAVIEMGANHQGEIDYLSRITRPQVAMITNAGPSHLEGFGGLDGVAKGKGELFANLGSGDTAILNIDDHYADYWRTLLKAGVKLKTFSLHNQSADVYASAISGNGQQFRLHAAGDSIDIALPSVGLHNVTNALGCAACALALGIDLSSIAKGLGQFSNAQGRLNSLQLQMLTLIDDSYNANPMSMRAAADTLSKVQNYRIMVVGDMAELGDDAGKLHGQLGKDLKEKADTFLCLGKYMVEFAYNNPKAKHFDTLESLETALTGLLDDNPQATVLVKGSRSMKMERIVNFIKKTYEKE